MGDMSRSPMQALLLAIRVVAGQAPVIADQADIAPRFNRAAQGFRLLDARQRQAAGPGKTA